MSGLFRSLIQKMVKVRSNRATSSRNGGRNHLGTPSDIKSEWWATSSRIRGRLPPESAPSYLRLWFAGGIGNAMRWLELLVAGIFIYEITKSTVLVALVIVA